MRAKPEAPTVFLSPRGFFFFFFFFFVVPRPQGRKPLPSLIAHRLDQEVRLSTASYQSQKRRPGTSECAKSSSGLTRNQQDQGTHKTLAGKAPGIIPHKGIANQVVWESDPLKTLLILPQDRKSTRLNSSHVRISYAVFCLKKKKKRQKENTQQ